MFGDKLQKFERATLALVKTLEDKAYAANIAKIISEVEGRKVSIAQVVVAIKRLQNKDMVEENPLKVRFGTGKGSRHVSVYKISKAGEKVLLDADVDNIGAKFGPRSIK